MPAPPLPGTPLPPHPDGSPEWQAQRREGIGSSDASAILGLSAWESPHSLWRQKTGRDPLNPPVSEEVERLRRFGHVMEPITRAMTEEQLGIAIDKPSGAVHHPDHTWLRANLDGWTEDGRIAEFKNVHQSQAAQWDGQIPDHAEIQVTHSGLVLGVDHAIVAGLIGGNRLEVRELTLSPIVKEIIWEAEQEFWEQVKTDTPPPLDGHERTLESIMSEWPHEDGSAQVEEIDVADWLHAFREAHEAEQEAKRRKREARAHLAALMDGHDTLATGDRVWARVRRGRLRSAQLKAEHPDLWEKYLKPAPAFDLAAFKKDHPDTYEQFRSIIVTPTEE